MCMQCVAQGAPFVGVAVTMLNRRNIKTLIADRVQRTHRTAQAPAPAVPATIPDDGPGPDPDPLPADATHPTSAEPVGATF
jgi:hypothetical protein